MTSGCLDERLTTSSEAAQAYRDGIEALLLLDPGALEHFARALALDPTFALAHADLALIGHTLQAPVDIDSRLRAAELHARRSRETERSHVRAVACHLAGDRQAIRRHLARHPDDPVLRSVSVS